jgi:hypothetical protein
MDRSVIVQRLKAQLLSGPPARETIDVIGHLLAVQAQDGRGARLAIRARTVGLRATDVDQALNDRAAVVSWLNRGTLHLVRTEDYWWLHALTTPRLATSNARRLTEEGVEADAAERGVAAIERALVNNGPQTRNQLRDAVAAVGVRVAGQALVHLLALATLRGLIVRGPMLGDEQAFVLVREWLGEPPPLDRDTALAELARRYLVSHGPATEGDLAKWSGLGLRDVRRGLTLIGSELEPRGYGLLALPSTGPDEPAPPPRLLGAFDPLLMGWQSREPILGPHSSIVTVNGLFRPFALVQSRAVATWSLNGGQVKLNPLVPINEADAATLDHDARDVQRFLGKDFSKSRPSDGTEPS